MLSSLNKPLFALVGIFTFGISALATSLPTDPHAALSLVNEALYSANGAWDCTFHKVGQQARRQCGVSDMTGPQNYGEFGVFGTARNMIAGSLPAQTVLYKPDAFSANVSGTDQVILEYKVNSGTMTFSHPKASMSRTIDITMDKDLKVIQKIEDVEILNDPSAEFGSANMHGGYTCVPRGNGC